MYPKVYAVISDNDARTWYLSLYIIIYVAQIMYKPAYPSGDLKMYHDTTMTVKSYLFYAKFRSIILLPICKKCNLITR